MPFLVEIGGQCETTNWRSMALGITIDVVGIVVG
jgi:hypothetical protein